MCLGSVEKKMLQYILHVVEKVKRAAWQHKELSSVLCDDLGGWDQGAGKGTLEGGVVRVPMVYSLCCTAETNTTL